MTFNPIYTCVSCGEGFHYKKLYLDHPCQKESRELKALIKKVRFVERRLREAKRQDRLARQTFLKTELKLIQAQKQVKA